MENNFYNKEIFNEAILLREKGYNCEEIHARLSKFVPKSSITNWLSRSAKYEELKLGELTIKRQIGWENLGGKKAQQKTSLWEIKCSCGNIINKNQEYIHGRIRAWNKHIINNYKTDSIFHCDENPIHSVDIEFKKYGYIEIFGIKENTGEIPGGKRNIKKRVASRSRYLLLALCHNCNAYTKNKPLFIDPNTFQKRVDKSKNLSCGCWNNARTHGYSSLDNNGRENWFYKKLLSCKTSARIKKVPFDLTFEYLKELGIPKICPVLGIPIELLSNEMSKENLKFRSPNSPSIDRFYPEKGYVQGNIQIISWRANNLKRNGSPEDWIKLADWCDEENVRRKLEGTHPDQKQKRK